MCLGYPKRIVLEELAKKCQPIENKFKSIKRSTLYSKILLSRGFGLNDFKIGREMIFFRSTKFYILERLIRDFEENREDTLEQLKRSLIKSMWYCVMWRLCARFLGKGLIYFNRRIEIFSQAIHSKLSFEKNNSGELCLRELFAMF